MIPPERARRAVSCIRVSRRSFLASLGASIAMPQGQAQTTAQTGLGRQISKLEGEIGGHIGLAVLDIRDGGRLLHRADERFAMCSTFKLMLAAAVLTRVDSNALRLDQPVSYSRSELLPNSPVTEARVGAGALPLETMLQAMVERSDNTAANQLLTLIGGPRDYTAYLRGIGDPTTRLDRMEPELNSNLPGDERDTTTPNAMLEDMQRVLLGEVLSRGSRERLLQWMRDCKTGRERLRARLPAGWEAGDKTGTGSRGAVNDLAILFPPKRQPLLVACYTTGSRAPVERLNRAHAQIGALVATEM
jgi:beta-lactamase class A